MNRLSGDLVAAIKPLELKLKLVWVGVFPAFGMILPPNDYQPLAAAIAGGVSVLFMLFHFPSITRRFSAGLELAHFE